MLFNSIEFLFLFLPVVLLGWHLAGKSGVKGLALHWLLAASLFFYAWWHPPHLLLLLAVLGMNYFLCLFIGGASGESRKRWLVVAVGANLLLLGYYKYAGFISGNLALWGVPVPETLVLALPLGISFYTFQQIAFAVDVYRGCPPERRPGMFALVVTLFPHLIAGPILHPRKILPQLDGLAPGGLRAVDLAPGFSLFVLGLFKKTVIADGLSAWVAPVFDAPAGTVFSLLDTWTAAFAYTFQIYFDFSGYSDMAIGLGLMFGLRIPFNFNSPYKATSIIDFWRRWHMTLSELLRDYVYIPLGGNRKGPARRHVNLMLTMLIGGLWHGAGWTFILWGGIHGAALVVTHLWRSIGGATEHGKVSSRWRCWVGWALTFFLLIMTWVIFRAGSLERAWEMFATMFGAHGLALPPSYVALLEKLGVGRDVTGITVESRWLVFLGAEQVALFTALILWVKFLPNSQQLMGLEEAEPISGWLGARLRWRPSVGWAVVLAMAFVVALVCMARSSEFLYFQF